MGRKCKCEFTTVELRDILYLVNKNKEEGIYIGNHQQFYNRQDRIISEIESTLSIYNP
jgi:hypothetical protein